MFKISLNKSLKTWDSTDNLLIRIYLNKIENRITFKIKTGYYLEVLTPETEKLLGSTKSKINKDENGENVLHLETTEVVLIHCNIVNNSCQQNSRVLFTFVPNKSFSQLVDIRPRIWYLQKLLVQNFNQNSKPLEIEDKINTTLFIN